MKFYKKSRRTVTLFNVGSSGTLVDFKGERSNQIILESAQERLAATESHSQPALREGAVFPLHG